MNVAENTGGFVVQAEVRPAESSGNAAVIGRRVYDEESRAADSRAGPSQVPGQPEADDLWTPLAGTLLEQAVVVGLYQQNIGSSRVNFGAIAAALNKQLGVDHFCEKNTAARWDATLSHVYGGYKAGDGSRSSAEKALAASGLGAFSAADDDAGGRDARRETGGENLSDVAASGGGPSVGGSCDASATDGAEGTSAPGARLTATREDTGGAKAAEARCERPRADDDFSDFAWMERAPIGTKFVGTISEFAFNGIIPEHSITHKDRHPGGQPVRVHVAMQLGPRPLG